MRKIFSLVASGYRNHIAPQPIPLQLAYMAALCLSIYSGITTLHGFANFTGEEKAIFPVVSLLPTLGIQTMLVIAAFLFGRELRYVNTFWQFVTKSGWLILCLFAMFCSVFFSFDSVFSQVAKDGYKTTVADDNAFRTARGFLEEVPATVETEIGRVKRQLELESADFVRDMREIGRKGEAAAAELNQRLEIAARKRREAEARRINALRQQQQIVTNAQRQKEAALADKTRLATDVATLEQNLQAAQALTTQAQQEFVAKQTEAKSKRDEADKEAGGAGATGRVGKGPRFRALDAEAGRLKVQANALERVFKRRKRESDALARQLAAKKQQLALVNGKISEQNVVIDGNRQPGNNAPGAQKADPASLTVRVPQTTVTVTAFNAQVTAFDTTPERSRLQTLSESCNVFVSELVKVGKASAKDSTKCAAPQLEALMTKLEKLQAARTVLVKQGSVCDPKTLVAGEGFDASVKKMTECLRASGLDARASEALDNQLSTLKREQSASSHPFYHDWNALHSGDTMAWLALTIAIGVDSLVLISGLLGERATFSPMGRRGHAEVTDMLEHYGARDFKMVLDAIRPAEHSEHPEFIGFVPDNVLARQPAVKQVLLVPGNRRLRDGSLLAKVEDSEQARGIWISQSFREELNYHLNRQTHSAEAKRHAGAAHMAQAAPADRHDPLDPFAAHEQGIYLDPQIDMGESLSQYSKRSRLQSF